MEMNCHVLRIAIVFVPLVLQYAWPAASFAQLGKSIDAMCGGFSLKGESASSAIERMLSSCSLLTVPWYPTVVFHPRPHKPESQKIRGGLWTIVIDMTIRGSLCLQAAHTRPCSLAIM